MQNEKINFSVSHGLSTTTALKVFLTLFLIIHFFSSSFFALSLVAVYTITNALLPVLPFIP